MSKKLKILFAVVAIVFISAVVTVIISLNPSDSTFVEIVQDNKIIFSLDLSKEKNRTIRIESADGGWNDIKIEIGEIFVSDADCPDHTCVRSGVLRSELMPIVCLPHRLVIRFSDKESS